jgi:exodeoxyribonuclease VII large subunit
LISNPSLRLSELAAQIQQAITGVFSNQSFWVIADLTNHTYKQQTNYHYFELVEKDTSSSKILAKIGGRAWGNASINISNFEQVTGQKFSDNIHVLLQVSVQYSATFGLQLNLIDVNINFTLGQFEQQRNATLLKLTVDNPTFIQKIGKVYFTRNNQLSLKKIIRRIAVLSSDTSAGRQDFIHTLFNNNYGYKFIVDDYPTVVQGDNNSGSLVLKVVEVYESGIDYDLVVIIRGGGSQSDFLIFDNYEVCRAIAKFPIPIVTGIGHHKNESIADLMAHTSTKTPTKAAEFILGHNKSFEDSLLAMHRNILIKSQQLLSNEKHQLSHIKSKMIRDMLRMLNHHKTKLSGQGTSILLHPYLKLANHHKDLLHLGESLKGHNKKFFMHKRQTLDHYSSLIRIMSPQNLLNKGFALIKINGQVISNSEHILPGMKVSIQLSSTEILTQVISKKQL